jgi:uncharacterized protein
MPPGLILDPSWTPLALIETNISWLVFEADLVHKVKRPVVYPFIDLGTPERREAMCRREVELNRRFAPDVYLGVEDVLDAAGRVVDHAVLMRRMPAATALSSLIAAPVDVTECVRRIARAIARTHGAAPTTAEISAVATPEALHDLWQASLDQMGTFTPGILDADVMRRVRELAHQYLDGREALLRERIERGRIVDGHGDLLADDIFCLDDGPRLLDCLEFDDRLRFGDVVLDVAFLAMDLERLGRPDLAVAFLGWYREFSGELHPASLEHHYVAYRSLVRAKVNCLRGGEAEELARTFLRLCHRHLLEGRIRLVVVGGLPCTGKSTLAAGLGDVLSWTVVRSDELRKELVGLDPRERVTVGYQQDIYDERQTERTYAAMIERARRLLGRGECVILDASFADAQHRASARELAASCAAELVELRCDVPAQLAMARMATRAGLAGEYSDATPEVADAMARRFDPWPQAVTINTTATIDETLSAARAVIEATGGHGGRRSAGGGRFPARFARS